MCHLQTKVLKRQAHHSPQNPKGSLTSVVVTLQSTKLESQAPANAAVPLPTQPPRLSTACLSPAAWP